MKDIFDYSLMLVLCKNCHFLFKLFGLKKKQSLNTTLHFPPSKTSYPFKLIRLIMTNALELDHVFFYVATSDCASV